jgi:hypothetical protein
MSSTQLESPQSEVQNSTYELKNTAMSAVLADSECSLIRRYLHGYKTNSAEFWTE